MRKPFISKLWETEMKPRVFPWSETQTKLSPFSNYICVPQVTSCHYVSLVMLLLITQKYQGTHFQENSDKTTFDSDILFL